MVNVKLWFVCLSKLSEVQNILKLGIQFNSIQDMCFEHLVITVLTRFCCLETDNLIGKTELRIETIKHYVNVGEEEFSFLPL